MELEELAKKREEIKKKYDLIDSRITMLVLARSFMMERKLELADRLKKCIKEETLIDMLTVKVILSVSHQKDIDSEDMCSAYTSSLLTLDKVDAKVRAYGAAVSVKVAYTFHSLSSLPILTNEENIIFKTLSQLAESFLGEKGYSSMAAALFEGKMQGELHITETLEKFRTASSLDDMKAVRRGLKEFLKLIQKWSSDNKLLPSDEDTLIDIATIALFQYSQRKHQ